MFLVYLIALRAAAVLTGLPFCIAVILIFLSPLCRFRAFFAAVRVILIAVLLASVDGPTLGDFVYRKC